MPAECCKEFFKKIPEDVPVFTLVGYDSLAISTIRFWIDRAEEYGVNHEKIDRAKEHLKAIESYQDSNPKSVKLPD